MFSVNSAPGAAGRGIAAVSRGDARPKASWEEGPAHQPSGQVTFPWPSAGLPLQSLQWPVREAAIVSAMQKELSHQADFTPTTAGTQAANSSERCLTSVMGYIASPQKMLMS